MPETPPPFPYPGSKSAYTDEIVEKVPQHTHFVDPFVGAGGVPLALPRPPGITYLADADADLIHCLKTIRDHPDELISRLKQYPYARETYRRAQEVIFETTPSSRGIDRAALYYFHRRAAFAGADGEDAGFRATADGRRNAARQYWNSLDRLHPISARLQNTTLRAQDWRATLAAVPDEGHTVVFVDPPYRGTADHYTIQTADGRTASDIDHTTLFSKLDALATRTNVDILLTLDRDTPQLENKWTRFSLGQTENTSGSSAQRSDVLLTSFTPDTGTSPSPSLAHWA
ncbi:DNA adenine methylase [Halobaculum sp. MBLA0147]|uniref:DNA adenine methylase n=1 Tax=Halobaculum sp. MBLA0147 TaxID=3079934 RepID=UPI0035261C49